MYSYPHACSCQVWVSWVEAVIPSTGPWEVQTEQGAGGGSYIPSQGVFIAACSHGHAILTIWVFIDSEGSSQVDDFCIFFLALIKFMESTSGVTLQVPKVAGVFAFVQYTMGIHWWSAYTLDIVGMILYWPRLWLCYCCAHKKSQGQWKRFGQYGCITMVIPCSFRTSTYCT